MSGKLIVFTGLPAAGKDTIIEMLLDKMPHYNRIVTYTNRPKRKGEIPGKELNFVSTPRFESMIQNNEFFEHVKHGPYYKGTSNASIKPVLDGKHLTWNIEVTRAGSLEETFEEKLGKNKSKLLIQRTKVIFLKAESMEIALSRFTKRDSNSSVNEFRLRWKQIQNFVTTNKHKFPHIVTNPEGKPEEALQKIEKIINLS